MFNNLQNLGWGLVGFALIIGVGSVVLTQFGGAVAVCNHYDNTSDTFTWNRTYDLCVTNNSNATLGGADGTPKGAWTNTNYLLGELGQSGLAGWTPAIIAISVGMLIFGAFLIGGGTGRRY